ncbi:MAG TPA: DUF4395 domain-containing protein [Acidimicrobiia bacterium]
MSARRLFSFPNPVNELSARLVAAGVLVMAVSAIAFDQPWLLIPIAYGFLARVLTGPTLSPLGQLVTKVLTPRLPLRAKYVPGPPKRFAQGIGATLSLAAVVAYFGFGSSGAAYVLLGLIVIAATLESVFAFCIGCAIFGVLMHWGVIPDEVCDRCNDIWGGGLASGRVLDEQRLPEVGRVLDEERRDPPHERQPQRDAQHAR